MIIMAIDPGITNLGYTVMNEQGIIFEFGGYTKLKLFQQDITETRKICAIINFIQQIAENNNVTYVVTEGFFASKYNGLQVYQRGGFDLLLDYIFGNYHYCTINPQWLKSFFGIKKRVKNKKDTIPVILRHINNLDPKAYKIITNENKYLQEHVVEAYGLGIIGANLIMDVSPSIKINQTYTNKIINKNGPIWRKPYWPIQTKINPVELVQNPIKSIIIQH